MTIKTLKTNFCLSSGSGNVSEYWKSHRPQNGSHHQFFFNGFGISASAMRSMKRHRKRKCTALIAPGRAGQLNQYCDASCITPGAIWFFVADFAVIFKRYYMRECYETFVLWRLYTSTGVFRISARGAIQKNRILAFVFSMQINAPGRLFGSIF